MREEGKGGKINGSPRFWNMDTMDNPTALSTSVNPSPSQVRDLRRTYQRPECPSVPEADFLRFSGGTRRFNECPTLQPHTSTVEDDTVKYFVPIPTTIVPIPIRISACLSIFCCNCCPPSLAISEHKHLFSRVTVVLQLHTCLQSNFTAKCHYRYRGITAFPITAPSSNRRSSNFSPTRHGRRAFAIAGPSARNSLPDPVRNANDTEAVLTFQAPAQIFLFARYYSALSELGTSTDDALYKYMH